MKRLQLKRDTKDNSLAQSDDRLEAWLADTYLSRLRGLLGRKRLGDGEGLLLKGCAAVHTIGMRYPLDIVFLDKNGRVLKCQTGVKPFRTASASGAYYTLELNKGTINKQGISVNDLFSWEQAERDSTCRKTQ
jgi:uncharacterized membrane protein (UPF0127 family)